MAINKKGVVFTMMAIVIASVIVATAGFFTPQQSVHEDVTLLRVTITDNLVRSFMDYSEVSLRVTTRAALDNLTEILANTPDEDMITYYDGIEELEHNLWRCLSGTSGAELLLHDTPFYSGACIEDNSFIDRLDVFINLVSQTYAVDISYELTPESYTINQTLLFEATATIGFEELIIVDPASNANWTLNDFNITTRVPLYGLKDPVTTKFARSEYTTNSFEPYLFNQYSPRPDSNVSAMLDLMNERSFVIVRDRAPSILGRYIGDFNNSPFGVEALINGSQINITTAQDFWPAQLAQSSGQQFSNYSYIDHQLFVSQEENSFAPQTFRCDSQGVLRAINETLDDTTRSFFWAPQNTLINNYNITSNNRVSC